MKQLRDNRTVRASGVLLIGLALAAVFQGVAGAGARETKSEKATATNYAAKGDCGGANTAFTAVGQTTFTRNGSTMKLKFKETGLTPNTAYNLVFFEASAPGSCARPSKPRRHSFRVFFRATRMNITTARTRMTISIVDNIVASRLS